MSVETYSFLMTEVRAALDEKPVARVVAPMVKAADIARMRAYALKNPQLRAIDGDCEIPAICGRIDR